MGYFPLPSFLEDRKPKKYPQTEPEGFPVRADDRSLDPHVDVNDEEGPREKPAARARGKRAAPAAIPAQVETKKTRRRRQVGAPPSVAGEAMELGVEGAAVMTPPPPPPAEEVARTPAAPAPAAPAPAADGPVAEPGPCVFAVGPAACGCAGPGDPLPLLRAGVNPAWSDAPSSSARPVITEVMDGAEAAQKAAADAGQPDGREMVVAASSGTAADDNEVFVTGSKPASAVLTPDAILAQLSGSTPVALNQVRHLVEGMEQGLGEAKKLSVLMEKAFTESVRNTRDLGPMIQDKEKELERLKAKVARLEESNKARQAQFDQLAAAKHQLEVSIERGKKTADIRAEALKNFETICTQQEGMIQYLRHREEDLNQHLRNVSEMVIAHYPEVTEMATEKLPLEEVSREQTALDLVKVVAEESNGLCVIGNDLFHYIWPDAGLVVHDMASLAVALSKGIDVLEVHKEWAAQGGAEMALAMVKSWYPGVDLSVIDRGFRLGMTYYGLRESLPALQACGLKIGTYVDLDHDFSAPGEPRPFHWEPAPWNPIDVASSSQPPPADAAAAPC